MGARRAAPAMRQYRANVGPASKMLAQRNPSIGLTSPVVVVSLRRAEPRDVANSSVL